MTISKQQHFILNLFIAIIACATAFSAQAQRLQRDVPPPPAKKNTTATVREQLRNAPINNNNTDSQVKDLLSFAFQFKGVPYRYGQASPRGFDCSGFTSYVFKKFGFSLDRTSGGQVNDGRRIARNELKPGDLVFFNGRARGKRVGHVGIVTEVNQDHFKFIHASCHRGITESNSTETYYQQRYVGACRVIE
ncbi:MAG: C40 family peptidase [Muribaculaceae bacterium]|nr:C40 family peptidase [Muribaculaceae bacterium]MBQ4006988.1 C40 family peptidase [Muribaculaceae bacterium]